MLHDPNAAAALYVIASSGKLQIYNANGVLLVEPTDIDVQGQSYAISVLHALESIVRYRTILALTNGGQASQLVGKVKLRLRHYATGQPAAQAQELPAEAVGPGGELAVYFHPDQPDRNLYVVDVINELPLEYLSTRLYPQSRLQHPAPLPSPGAARGSQTRRQLRHPGPLDLLSSSRLGCQSRLPQSHRDHRTRRPADARTAGAERPCPEPRDQQGRKRGAITPGLIARRGCLWCRYTLCEPRSRLY